MALPKPRRRRPLASSQPTPITDQGLRGPVRPHTPTTGPPFTEYGKRRMAAKAQHAASNAPQPTMMSKAHVPTRRRKRVRRGKAMAFGNLVAALAKKKAGRL